MPPKTVHVIRHAQGYHNVNPANHCMPDPRLTPFGVNQCKSLSTSFPIPPSSTSTLIVASPLKRTLYTALFTFPDVIKNRKLAILALPEIQETSDLPCDTGSKLAELKREFQGQAVDLSLVEKAGDSWCSKKGRWSPMAEAIQKRAREAREWVWSREEEVVVLVTHGGFLHYFTEDWTGHNKVQGTGWANAEYRTYEFASSAPGPAYSLKETTASRERRAGTEKPLTEAEDRNLKRSAQVQKEQQQDGSKKSQDQRKTKDDSKKSTFGRSKA